jgi:ubiquinone/menaquinone biosynthesis C-methylase UbiE
MHMEPSSSSLTIGRFVVPHVVASHFHIRAGDVVADFGAGVGYFIETLATLVGAEGRVYACEIQKDFVEKIGTLARSKGLAQVQPLWADVEEVGGSKIPDGVLDVAIMVNTFFQFEDRQSALKEVERTLRVGGKFFLIDWSESFGGLGPQPEHVVLQDTAIAEGETAGFSFERSFDAGDHHYGLAFRRV